MLEKPQFKDDYYLKNEEYPEKVLKVYAGLKEKLEDLYIEDLDLIVETVYKVGFYDGIETLMFYKDI